MKHYPAIDVRSADVDLLYAALDDLAPTAIEERDDGVRAFFLTTDARDRALAGLADQFSVTATEVCDENWATRSQSGLEPVMVGRITIVPNPQSLIPNPQSLIPNHCAITIQPSMGFGTGHHATTRLCLAAMQEIDLRGKTVLDVGTGSGILAIAADRLGAAAATGIDCDPDAIRSATENLALNPDATHVTFAVADLARASLPVADVVTANLTGALLVRSAPLLLGATKAGGALILSGLTRDERDAVGRAFAEATTVRERAEDEWVGLTVKKR